MKIMFLEDEPNQRLGLSALIRSKGHTVIEASDIAQAMSLLRENCFDLLLIDIMIFRNPQHGAGVPNSSEEEAGKDLLVKLRAKQLSDLKTASDVPTVVITAVSELGVREALERLDSILILQKPIDPADTWSEIESFIKGKNI